MRTRGFGRTKALTALFAVVSCLMVMAGTAMTSKNEDLLGVGNAGGWDYPDPYDLRYDGQLSDISLYRQDDAYEAVIVQSYWGALRMLNYNVGGLSGRGLSAQWKPQTQDTGSRCPATVPYPRQI